MNNRMRLAPRRDIYTLCLFVTLTIHTHFIKKVTNKAICLSILYAKCQLCKRNLKSFQMNLECHGPKHITGKAEENVVIFKLLKCHVHVRK